MRQPLPFTALGPNPSGRRDDDGERKARRIVCRWASYRAAATGREWRHYLPPPSK